MEQVRCFVAIELPEGLRTELVRLQSQFKMAGQAPVKWVDPKGIHLTLKFLGGVETSLIQAVVDGLTRACQGIPPFHLQVSGTGLFPGPRQPRVVWVGLKGDVETVVRLQGQVEANLEPLGFPTEARSFTPHITLGRVRPEGDITDKRNLAERVVQARFEAATPLEVEAVSLMRSQLTPSGAIYSRLAEVKLL